VSWSTEGLVLFYVGIALNFVETQKLKTPITPSPWEKVWDEAMKKGFLAFG
jgi:hypothetical protein